MHPRKTEKARLALEGHAAPLNLRARRALILCDGQRSASQLTEMLGPDTLKLLLQLAEDGYLEFARDDRVGAPAEPPAAPPSAAAPVAAAPPAPAAPAASAAAPARPPTRRSWVAARMYLTGILELQRSPIALEHRNALQFAPESEAIAPVRAALAWLDTATTPSYMQRVRERLQEVLPEECMPALDGAGEAATA